MTGLMFYRPDDHIEFIKECLTKVKNNGIDSIKWNIFIDQRRKNQTPLPPISPENGRNRINPREPTFLRGEYILIIFSLINALRAEVLVNWCGGKEVISADWNHT